jgi:hypothetical protein
MEGRGRIAGEDFLLKTGNDAKRDFTIAYQNGE